LQLEEGLSDFNNIWYKYSRHNRPSNDHSSSHLTQCVLLHYLGKTEHTKYALKWTKNVRKKHRRHYRL